MLDLYLLKLLLRLLHQLLEYAYTGPKPTKGLAVKVTECPGCMPSSFVALCGA